jgi:predicted transglutaminase-like protease
MKTKTKQTLTTIIMTLRRTFQGHFPTSNDVENSTIKSLASRLKAESYEETLTNILEWQGRNIEFWTERHPILTLLTYIYSRIVPAFLILAYIVPFFTIGILVMLNINTIVLMWLVQILVWSVQNLWCFIAILATSTITIVGTMILVLHLNRRIPWKEVPRGLWNIFVPSISIQFLLENKLGICRDYAKLTACLLLNIYPNEKIYFAYAPSHVATGIMIKDRLYMLDQRLPILTIEKWNDYRKPKKSDRIERFDFVNNVLQKVDKSVLLRMKTETSIDTKKLAVKMEKLLNIRKQTGDKAISLLETPIQWKKGAILYEDNEMVDCSLARRLEMEIPNELVRIDQIVGIEVERRKDDLMFKIRFSQNQ